MITLMGSFGEANKNATFRYIYKFFYNQNYRGRILLSQLIPRCPLSPLWWCVPGSVPGCGWWLLWTLVWPLTMCNCHELEAGAGAESRTVTGLVWGRTVDTGTRRSNCYCDTRHGPRGGPWRHDIMTHMTHPHGDHPNCHDQEAF